MRKMGLFLIFLGIFLLVLYILSDIAASPAIGFLLTGGLLLAVGIWIRSSTKPPETPPSTRFRAIREWQQQRQQAREKKKEKDKPKTQR